MDLRIDAFESKTHAKWQTFRLRPEKNGIVLLTPFLYSCWIQFKLRMLLASESLTFSEAYKVRSFNQKINLLFDTFRLNGVDDCLIQMDETDKTFIWPAHKPGKLPGKKIAEPIQRWQALNERDAFQHQWKSACMRSIHSTNELKIMSIH